tara:strand:+ start:1976 stop:4105 length:2130 start_codon:yes stop_codon:yes gene_type:complete
MVNITPDSKDEIVMKNGAYILKRTFEAPNNFRESPLIKCYVLYYQSSKFKRLNLTSRYQQYQASDNFLNWIYENYSCYENISESLIYPEYFNHLSLTGKQSENVKYILNAICKPLRLAKERKLEGDIWDKKLHHILANKPAFKTDNSNKKPAPSMSLLSKKINASDEDLITSLRLATQWFISESQRQRDIFLKNDRVNGLLNKLISSGHSIDKPPFSHFPNGSLSSNSKVNREEFFNNFSLCKEFYGALLEAAIDSEDPLIMERIFCSLPIHLKQIKENLRSEWSIEYIAKELKRRISNGRICIPRGTRYFGLLSTTYADLVMPGESENLAMMWFLASDRIQKNGVIDLELSDFNFTKEAHDNIKETVQINFDKDRSAQPFHSTPIYNSSSVVYDTYKHWYDIMSSAQSFLNDDDRAGKAIRPWSTEIFNGGRRIIHGRTLHIGLLAVEGSFTHKKCVDDIGNICFLKLMRQLMSHNLVVSVQEAKYEQAAKISRDRNEDSPKRSDYVKLKRKWLSNQSIAKSRVEMDDCTEGFVGAALTAHSERTKAEVYKDRSETDQVTQSQLNFAAKVGDAMAKDAAKVKALVERTNIVSLEEIRNELGLASPSEEINKILEELNDKFDTGLFGEIIADGKTYIVSDPLIAALMISYIAYIDENIHELASAFQSRVAAVRIHQQFLKEILSGLPYSVIADGKAIAKDYKFPFPPLF